MRGTMMEFPLVLPALLQRAGKILGDTEIASYRPDKSSTRTTFLEFSRRARQLAQALAKLGVKSGDRVGCMMWNHSAHLEAFFGVPCSGAILHSLNLRLHPQEIAKIVNHAEDRFLIIDDVLLPLYEKFADDVKFEAVIVVPYGFASVPEGFLNYEEFLEEGRGESPYPRIDENDGAAMCFTSGTTGFSQGVIYTHRSLVLHSLSCAMVDCMALSHHDTVMPLAPMFHANAWGVPHTAVMVGSRLVFPGPNVEPEHVLDTMLREGVTIANAVPTVWINVLDALEKNPRR